MADYDIEMSHELLARASRLLAQAWNHRLAEHGITYAGHLALSVAATSPVSHQGALAQALHVRLPTLGAVLDRLEHQGYIITYPGQDDMRRRMVRVTSRGQQVLRLGKEIEETLLGQTEGLRTQLLQLLPRLIPQPRTA